MQKTVQLDQMGQLAQEVLAHLRPLHTAHILALSGNLGAGKTTFTQQLATELGVEQQITSPTFVLMKRYELNDQPFTNLIHIDAYRLESSTELTALDFDRYAADPSNLIVIEWPEKVADILPEHKTTIAFEVADQKSRKVTIVYAKEN